MVILVGGDGGRRAVRVGTVVALVLLVIGLVLGRSSQVEVLGVETESAPPAALLATADGADVRLRTTPGDRDVAALVVRSGTVVGVVDDHGSWLRVSDLATGTLGWVRAEEVHRSAPAFVTPVGCPVPIHGAVDGPAVAMVAPGVQVDLIDAHRTGDGELWVGVRAEGLPGIGLVPVDVVTGPSTDAEGTCPAVAVDPTAAAHRH